MKKATLFLLAGYSLIQSSSAQQTAVKAPEHNDQYFTCQFKNGENFATIFSRTIAVTGNDFQPVVRRISGTADYVVTGLVNGQPNFDAVFLYDGRPENRQNTGIRDSGKILIANGKSIANTYGSGLTYNALLWGNAPVNLRVGSSWDVNINQPWELGGPGHQKIEVVDADAAGHLIRLKRQGDGNGAYADDRSEMDIIIKDKPLKVQISPGKSHWVGYTTFKNGIVISDELIVTRTLTLSRDSLSFSASERQYILLNQMAM